MKIIYKIVRRVKYFKLFDFNISSSGSIIEEGFYVRILNLYYPIMQLNDEGNHKK